MLFLDILAGAAGALLLASSLYDLFMAVVVPRSVSGRYRASTRLARHGWQMWRALALRLDDAERREDRLAIFAPVYMMTLLVYWVASEIAGLGLVFWALRDGLHPVPSFGAALYFAGTSLLTIGYGDYAPETSATRFLSLVAGGTGLGTFAIVTTFLFQTFGAFQRREAFTVTISERTGAPPSGLTFIITHAKLGLMHDIDTILLEAQRWVAETMETHLAYPVLTYFRSSHDDESWVGTLGALLDATTLLLTTVDLEHRGEAEITARIARHLVRDFAAFFRLPTGDAAAVDYDEFVIAYVKLRELNIPLHPIESAWPEFSRQRAMYAGELDAMARWWRIPPAQWIGDRSRVRLHINA